MVIFDATMQEKIHNYLASREGKFVLWGYLALVVGAFVITFPKQTKLIIKLTRSILVKQRKKK